MMTVIAFFKAQQYVAWLLLIVALVAAGGYYHHTVYDGGIAAQQAIDQATLMKATKEAAEKTLAAQQRADTAELNYAREHDNLTNYIDAHPITGDDQLCHDAPIQLATTVPGPGSRQPRDVSTTAAAPVGEPVPTGVAAIPSNRLRLLDAAATLFDDQTSLIREFQAREPQP